MMLIRRTLLELRAIPRSRHAWTAAVALALLNTLLAFVLAPATGIMGFSMVSLVTIPTAMAPLAAASFASLRADRLSDRLHAAGVGARDMLLPRALALLLLGGLYLLSLIPFYLVLGAKMGAGWPEAASRFYYVGGGLVAYGVAAGFLFATLFPGTRGAPTALAGSLGTFSLLAGMLKGILVDALGPGILMRILHLLPHVALFEGAGFTQGSPLRGADPGRSQLAFVIYVVLMIVAAVAIRARYQNASGWRVGSRPGAVLALAFMLLVPVAAATGEYEPRERGSGERPALDAVVVPRGAPFAGFDELHVFPLARSSAADVLVEKPRGPTEGMRVAVQGSPDANAKLAGTPRVEGDLLRVPITVFPQGAGGTDLALHRLTVRVELASGAQTASTHFGAEGEDPGPSLLLAGAPAVGLAALGAVLRRRSVSA